MPCIVLSMFVFRFSFRLSYLLSRLSMLFIKKFDDAMLFYRCEYATHSKDTWNEVIAITRHARSVRALAYTISFSFRREIISPFLNVLFKCDIYIKEIGARPLLFRELLLFALPLVFTLQKLFALEALGERHHQLAADCFNRNAPKLFSFLKILVLFSVGF